MSRVDFFLNTRRDVAEIQTIEIRHPSIKTRYLVRNYPFGVVARLEHGGLTGFQYYPFLIRGPSASDDLDFALTVQFGDIGEHLSADVALIDGGDSLVKPVLVYREFRSDDVEPNSDVLARVLNGPFVLDVQEINHTSDQVEMVAAARGLNQNGTGERYDLDRFPGLRSYV